MLITILMMATVPALWAQDTAWFSLGNYYYNCWVEDSIYLDHERCFMFGPQVPSPIPWGGEFAKQFIVEEADTLQVYGIAAALTTRLDWEGGIPTDPSSFWWDDYYHHISDKSLNDCYEYLRIYKPSSDSLVWLDQVRIHRLVDTPVYCFNAGQYLCQSDYPDSYIPVYEQYFDSAISVTDTFFVGMTQHTWQEEYTDDKGGRWRWKQMGLEIVSFYLRPEEQFPGLNMIRTITSDSNSVWTTNAPWSNPYYRLIFPILTPAPDTTFNPIDTTDNPIDTTVGPDSTLTGIGKVDMVGRYVSVNPNPAGDRATVVSSFGLTAIEAYDPQGRQLYTAPATGLKAELDVSAWPRGTVLLHIHTPAGTTVKTLLLR